jgi:hypothetical protein
VLRRAMSTLIECIGSGMLLVLPSLQQGHEDRADGRWFLVVGRMHAFPAGACPCAAVPLCMRETAHRAAALVDISEAASVLADNREQLKLLALCHAGASCRTAAALPRNTAMPARSTATQHTTAGH